MTRAHLWLLAPVALATLSACGKRAPAPLPAVEVAPDGDSPVPRPMPTDVPQPRELAVLGRTTDAEAKHEVFVFVSAAGVRFQHDSGARQTGEVRLPTLQPVRLTLISEDEPRRFEVLSLGLSVEVRPRQYTSVTVIANQSGTARFRCGEHTGPVQLLTMLESLAGLGSDAPTAGEVLGAQLFRKLQCVTCHSGDAKARGPLLEGLYGTKVPLRDKSFAVADEAYLNESIRRPRAKQVEGWELIMPAYGPQNLSELELKFLIDYLKTLKAGDLKPRIERFPPPVGAPTEKPGLNQRLERIGPPLELGRPRLEPLPPGPRAVAPPPRVTSSGPGG